MPINSLYDVTLRAMVRGQGKRGMEWEIKSGDYFWRSKKYINKWCCNICVSIGNRMFYESYLPLIAEKMCWTIIVEFSWLIISLNGIAIKFCKTQLAFRRNKMGILTILSNSITINEFYRKFNQTFKLRTRIFTTSIFSNSRIKTCHMNWLKE